MADLPEIFEEVICTRCGKHFNSSWSDEDALAESQIEFPEAWTRNEPMEVVCNDCFEKLMQGRSGHA